MFMKILGIAAKNCFGITALQQNDDSKAFLKLTINLKIM